MPTAFLSYSWDSESHSAWVKHLAAKLRANGIDTRLDQWAATPGDNLPAFMESAVRENDFVVVACTPSYKKNLIKDRVALAMKAIS